MGNHLTKFIVCLLLGGFPFRTFSQGREMQIAVILPFCSEMSNAELTKKKLGLVQKSSVEYYQGILMAMDSLKKIGFKAKVKVYDTNKDSLTIVHFFGLPEMKEMDLIVGPIFKEGIEIAAGRCKEMQVSHISPTISMNKPIRSPYLIKPNPEPSAYAISLAKYLKQTNADTARINLISDGKKIDKAFTPVFKQWIDSLCGPNVFTKTTLSKDLNLQDISQSLRGNILVMPINDDAVVNRLMKTLREPEFPVSVVGFESWLDFKTNDYDRWEKYKVHILSSFYVNFGQQHNFRFSYHEKYKTEPTELVYKGFDQLFYFGKLMLDNSSSWPEYIETGSETMHNSFMFEQDVQTENWVNKSVRILKFENYILSKVK